MRRSSDAESSKTKRHRLCHTGRTLLRKNWCWNMLFSSRSSSSNTSEKIASFSSFQRMSVRSTSSSAQPSDPPNLDFCNFTTTNNAHRGSASSYSIRNSIHLMSFPSAFPVLPT